MMDAAKPKSRSIFKNLPPELRAALNRRIRDREHREIESIWRWLEPQLPEGMTVCPETLRRYIKLREKAAAEYVVRVADLPPQPDPATMPAALLRQEIGALTSLARRAGERVDAVNRELDHRHTIQAKSTPRAVA
ncbi:MAG: hypothetical protein EPN21_14265 [Methylococcaceae bacterium]|nr:MAG: hypothetical protein EPN21_14265 [Methylococcaceae bacterium]